MQEIPWIPESEVAPGFSAPFEAALSEIPDALAIFTAEDSPIAACIQYVNPAFTRLSGYTPEQLLGHSSLLLAGKRPNLQHLREVARAPRQETYSAVTRKYRPDGVGYDVQMWISPLRDRFGKVTHYLLRERELGERGSGAQVLGS